MSMGTPLFFISKLKSLYDKYLVGKIAAKSIVSFISGELP